MRLSRYIAPAVLAGLLLILVAGVSRARTRAPVPHPAPHPATHPAPFALEAFAATSDRSWWVLGTSVCPRPWCLSIRHTSDAGRSFTSLPAPPGVWQLVFADARDGFAFGQAAWSTHDGGADWQRLSLPGVVRDMACGRGYVYAAVTGPHNINKLWRSPLARARWAIVPAAGDVSGGLWARGRDVLVQSADRTRKLGDVVGSDLLVSHDYGASFARHRLPFDDLPAAFQEVPSQVVWGYFSSGMFGGPERSPDDGRTWQPAGVDVLHEPSTAAFAAASALTAVVSDSIDERLYRTTDGGLHYTLAGPPKAIWEQLAFMDSEHGLGLGSPGAWSLAGVRLYYTSDGGRSSRA
jgi:hypothetical protein